MKQEHQHNERVQKLCDEIRATCNDRWDWTNEQVIVLDLINALYAGIAGGKYELKESEYIGLIIFALTAFFGNEPEDWEEQVRKKIADARKDKEEIKLNTKL